MCVSVCENVHVVLMCACGVECVPWPKAAEKQQKQCEQSIDRLDRLAEARIWTISNDFHI